MEFVTESFYLWINQGIYGDKAMADKFMLHKITLSVYYNKWLKRLDTKLNKQININSIKVPKFVKQTNNKTLLNNMGTSVMNSPISPPLNQSVSILENPHIVTLPNLSLKTKCMKISANYCSSSIRP